MKLIAKIFLNLLLILLIGNTITAMIKPSKFPTNPHRNFFRAGQYALLMNRFMLAENYNQPLTYIDASDKDLEEIIDLTQTILENPKYFELGLNATGMDKAKYRATITNIQKNAEEHLAVKRGLSKKHEERSKEEPQITTSEYYKLIGLYNYITEQLEPSAIPGSYIQSDNTEKVERILNIVNDALTNNIWLDLLEKKFNIPRSKLITILDKIKEDAVKELGKRGIALPAKLPEEQKPKTFEDVLAKLSVKELPIKSEEAQSHLEVEFSNQTTDKIVTAWVATGADNRWEMAKLIPLKDSKKMIPVKGTAIHLYIGSDGYLLLSKDGSLVLAKEKLSDKYMGRLVNKFLDMQEIKTFNIKPNAKITVIINPDSSITIAERK